MTIDYRNFEIELGRCLCDAPEVRVLNSPKHRPRARLDTVHLEGVTEQIARYNEARRTDPRVHRELGEQIGRRLYQAAFPGPIEGCLKGCLDGLRANRRDREEGLRLRFSFGESGRHDGALAQYPWELVFEEQLQYLGAQPETPIVRYLDLERRTDVLEIEPPFKVLAVLSSPSDQPILVDFHCQALEDMVPNQDWLQLHVLDGRATLENLVGKLTEHRDAGMPFHALHFVGHGGFLGGREGALAFETEEGCKQIVSGSVVAQQLAGFDELRLVVLASCKSAQMPSEVGLSPLTGAASALVARGVPAVVAMQFNISQRAAGAFTSAFYKALGKNKAVDEALIEGRRLVQARDPGTLEWATPVLFLRGANGRVFELVHGDRIPEKRIAIFNIEDREAPDLEIAAVEVDLTRHFTVENHRATITDPRLWNTEVLDLLCQKLHAGLSNRLRYRINLAAPVSVAFAAGYLLNVGTGHSLIVRQRGQQGAAEWDLRTHKADGPPWLDEEAAAATIPADFPLDPESADLAVVVATARPILSAVGHYLGASELDPPSVGHVIHACFPQAGATTVQDGPHAVALAQALSNRIDDHLAIHPHATVHFFLPGPNAFVLALGRLCHDIGTIQLYEFDRGRAGHGRYEPSITLPPGG